MHRNSRSQKFAAPTDRWIYRAIVVSCVLFIIILILAAVFDATIRWLHFFQALIYVAVIVLARRRNAWGYGAGAIIAAFWNWVNLVHTQFIAVFAAVAHFVLIAACVAGFLRRPNSSSLDGLCFLGGGIAAVVSFAVMIILFGPQYVPLLRAAFLLD